MPFKEIGISLLFYFIFLVGHVCQIPWFCNELLLVNGVNEDKTFREKFLLFNMFLFVNIHGSSIFFIIGMLKYSVTNTALMALHFS